MKFKCAACGNVHQVKDELAGKTVNCPVAKKPVKIPVAPATAVASVPAIVETPTKGAAKAVAKPGIKPSAKALPKAGVKPLAKKPLAKTAIASGDEEDGKEEFAVKKRKGKNLPALIGGALLLVCAIVAYILYSGGIDKRNKAQADVQKKEQDERDRKAKIAAEEKAAADAEALKAPEKPPEESPKKEEAPKKADDKPDEVAPEEAPSEDNPAEEPPAEEEPSEEVPSE